jgi:hypothetical protein
MKQRRGPTLVRREHVLTILAMCTLAGPLSGQDSAGATQEGTPAEGWETMTYDELLEAGFQEPPYQLDDVPYALLIDTFFEITVDWSDREGWWRSRGLDPESAAAQELRGIAADLAESHPTGPEPAPAEDLEELERLEERFGSDIEARNAWQRAREDRRFHALGEAFGRWLENRRAEGFPPESLLDRLVAGISMELASTDSMDELEEGAARNAAEFEAGLREVMETVPARLTAATREEGR